MIRTSHLTPARLRLLSLAAEKGYVLAAPFYRPLMYLQGEKYLEYAGEERWGVLSRWRITDAGRDALKWFELRRGRARNEGEPR
jgi:hypothetical protein